MKITGTNWLCIKPKVALNNNSDHLVFDTHWLRTRQNTVWPVLGMKAMFPLQILGDVDEKRKSLVCTSLNKSTSTLKTKLQVFHFVSIAVWRYKLYKIPLKFIVSFLRMSVVVCQRHCRQKLLKAPSFGYSICKGLPNKKSNHPW